MYNLIVQGLRETEEFECLGNLIHLNEDHDTPVFIPIHMNMSLMECYQCTSEMKILSVTYSYVWGRNPRYATFVPVQELFQSVILFGILIKAVALFEQWLVPKVDLNEIHLEDWATEHDHTLTVDVSGLTCISDLHTPAFLGRLVRVILPPLILSWLCSLIRLFRTTRHCKLIPKQEYDA